MPHLFGNRKSLNQHEQLTGEHKMGDTGQAILAVLFFSTWISDSFLNYSTVLEGSIPLALRILLGVVVFILAGYLAARGLYIVFGKKRAEPAVIQEGPFRFVRHPVYLGEILLYLGFLILNISLVAFVVMLIAIGFLHYISSHEEKLLIVRFGDDYQRYRKEVPMWIPFLPRK